MEYHISFYDDTIQALADIFKRGSGGDVEVEELDVTENGTYTASEGKAYNPVKVNVPNPSTGTLDITSNDTYDVTQYASVDVNVPNPSTGTLNISSNDTYDVTNYASAVVNVPNPSTGTLEISSNNTYDVTNYASVDVNVPNPSTGTLNVTENGDYDVTNYAGITVSVQSVIPIGVAESSYALNDLGLSWSSNAKEDTQI